MAAEQQRFFLPSEIISQLNRFIVGQEGAKKAVAVALRNRWRRQRVADHALRQEILPKNLLMIGPTGVGKTEIARRLASLSSSPFIKVEATKFTEVGYVGRDVEQIVRDLVGVAINMTRHEMREKNREATEHAVLKMLLRKLEKEDNAVYDASHIEPLREGRYDHKNVTIETSESSSSSMPLMDIPGVPGAQIGMMNVNDMIGRMMGGGRKKKRQVSVKDAKKILFEIESDKLMDEEHVARQSIEKVEEHGIVFLDEIDKICVSRDGRRGGDVSREGVQRDLLPLIEGTIVQTRHGSVKTDHILFIASGAFHFAKPSDLMPELQGRLPVRVSLESLSREDFVRILTEPENNLVRQYKALMETEGVMLEVTEDAIEEIAAMATKINADVENIGARRLHTLLEKVLEDISFRAGDTEGAFSVDKAYVRERLRDVVSEQDLSRFIL
ncbi:MAG: ATP-dependent protease ATPase subunit HslU [Alphaproteobacteria bacterium GM7ARS4]|nr:ATP-dependent protease ATPase subunit HslU [Alphaproteobacteria bacterium GM7ARS4]